MSPTSQAAETTASNVVSFLGSAAQLALRVGGGALPLVQFAAGFVPGLAPAVQVIGIAIPILEKIAAGAPIVAKAIDENRPAIDALVEAAPNVIGHLKELYAIATSAQPGHPDAGIAPAEVTQAHLEAFATGGLVKFSSIAQQSFFTPRDPRFDRVDPGNG